MAAGLESVWSTIRLLIVRLRIYDIAGGGERAGAVDVVARRIGHETGMRAGPPGPCPSSRSSELRRQQFEELVVGRTPMLLAGKEVVVGAIDRAQAPKRCRPGPCRGPTRRAGRVCLRNLDLSENEVEVGFDVGDDILKSSQLARCCARALRPAKVATFLRVDWSIAAARPMADERRTSRDLCGFGPAAAVPKVARPVRL